MGGKTSTQTASNTSEPWASQKPYLERNMERAEGLYNSTGPEYFNQSTVQGFSPQQEQAFGMAANRATNGNQTMKAAEGFNQDVLGGKYSGNPMDGQVFQNIASRVTPQVNAQFSSAGRYGSDAHTDTMTRAMTEAYAPYAAQQYNTGIDRMQQAASMAPTFAANDYQDIGALQEVGQQRQMLGQAERDDARARWDYNQDLPYNKLAQLQGLVGGNYGGTTTSSQPYYKPSPFSQVAGAGLSLAGLFG
jgi:hypothetical protein